MLITSFSNCIVTYADEDNRVYLGTTTCYNIPYDYNIPNSNTTVTAYNTKTYFFQADEEGLYKIKLPYNDECPSTKISANYLVEVNNDDVWGLYYCHLEQNQIVSFSVNDDNDYYEDENGSWLNFKKTKSYSVTIEKINEKTVVNNYIVNPVNKTAALKRASYGSSMTVWDRTIYTSYLSYPVEGIDEYAFYNYYNLEEVVIPEHIKYINDYAFTNCYKLKQVILKNDDCVYGKNAFYNCRNDLQIIGGRMGDVSGGETESVSIASADILGVKNKTYTGNEIKQNIAVAIDDESLTNGEDYTVTYSNNKKVGTATITVTGIGNYYGNIKKTFKINPKGTSIKSISSRSKGFYLKWNKQATQTSGYQIKYSTDKNFGKNNKTIDVSSNKTTSKTVKKLSKSKKYYVKVRTYKIVNGKAYFSAWSSAKSIKTKR